MSFTTFVYVVVGSSVLFLCYYALLWLPLLTRRDYRQGLLALARAVEVREQGTNGSAHLRAHYAVLVAQQLRLPASVTRDIEFAALLQEIGKVSVPYSILNKHEPLTEDEREVLKLHPVLGQRMIEQLPSLAQLAPIIRYHHERWDGSGYPDGLRGEEIPLASRILHVVGDFVQWVQCAQAQNVPATQHALEKVAAGKGTCYDPRVVEALEQVVRLKRAG